MNSTKGDNTPTNTLKQRIKELETPNQVEIDDARSEDYRRGYIDGGIAALTGTPKVEGMG